MTLDAHEIYPGLWQGSAPQPEDVCPERFDLVVFCAEEFQPRAKDFPCTRVLLAPNDDQRRPPTREEWLRAVGAAKIVAKSIRAGDKCLVTCMAGLNRSGLVSALVVHFLTGASGQACVEYVQARREVTLDGRLTRALFNDSFVAVLAQIPEGASRY
jgi:hypothetical protein